MVVTVVVGVVLAVEGGLVMMTARLMLGPLFYWLWWRTASRICDRR